MLFLHYIWREILTHQSQLINDISCDCPFHSIFWGFLLDASHHEQSNPRDSQVGTGELELELIPRGGRVTFFLTKHFDKNGSWVWWKLKLISIVKKMPSNCVHINALSHPIMHKCKGSSHNKVRGMLAHIWTLHVTVCAALVTMLEYQCAYFVASLTWGQYRCGWYRDTISGECIQCVRKCRIRRNLVVRRNLLVPVRLFNPMGAIVARKSPCRHDSRTITMDLYDFNLGIFICFSYIAKIEWS